MFAIIWAIKHGGEKVQKIMNNALNKILNTPIRLNLGGIILISLVQVFIEVISLANIEICRRMLNYLLSHETERLMMSSIIFCTVMIITIIMVHVNAYLIAHVRGRLQLALSNKLLIKNSNLYCWSRANLSSNDRVSVVTGDLERYVESLINKAFLFSSFMVIPCYVIYGITINAWITLMIIVSSIVLSILNKNNKLKLYEFNKEINDKYGLWTNYLWKALDNLEVIRAFLSKKKIISEHRKRDDDYSNTARKSWEAQLKVYLVEETADMMFTLVILSLSFVAMIIGAMPPANMLAMIQSLSSVQKKIFELPEQMIQLKELESIASRIIKFEQIPDDKGELELNEEFRFLQVKDLKISYDNQEIIKDINFKFEKGKFYVIAGSSGCGKSTLLKAIARLIPLDGGSICWNNTNLSEVTRKSYYQKAGYVEQNHVFIQGTIRENIVYGSLNEVAYNKALKESKLLDVFKKNNFTDELTISQSGYPLSSGERQMLAFASVLYNTKELVLLDESFSAIDPGKERIFYEKLKECSRNGTTVIMVSHRQTNFDIADEIVYMNQGKILENGSFEELCSNENDFYRWINSDFKEEEA